LRSPGPWLALGLAACAATHPGGARPPAATEYTADGRLPLGSLLRRFDTLAGERGWVGEIVHAYPDERDLAIRAWRTPHRGPALWLLAGIHGEEPAGPNAIAGSLDAIAAVAASGVPVVLLPLCNPRAYRNNWRYPNTHERDWRAGGGYSVGDSEHHLPDLESGTRPRAAAPPGPDTRALTAAALRLATDYPPRLVIDLHEDELSTGGGYIYAQGSRGAAGPAAAEVVRLLAASGIPLRMSGETRFGEPVAGGVVSQDDQGRPIRDGSIDELLAAPTVFVDGRPRPGPAAATVIVVETPTFRGARLDERVAAHRSVLEALGRLWNAGLR
jgi:hypothetical protein